MFWDIKGIQNIEMPLSWFKQRIQVYDLKYLRYVYISHGKKRFEGVYGLCRYPDFKVPYYRISCYLPGPFPSCVISENKGMVFKDHTKGWPSEFKNKKPTSNGRIKLEGKFTYWRRYLAYITLQTQDEALIWILGHEFFHFLKHSKQIAGRNYEWQADQYADSLLEEYKNHLTTKPTNLMFTGSYY